MAIKLEPDTRKWMTLSKDEKVAATIQELDNLNDPNEAPYFSNVAKHISKFDDMSKTTVHNAINHLIDLGIINAKWIKVESRWVRKFFVIGESKEWITKLTKEIFG